MRKNQRRAVSSSITVIAATLLIVHVVLPELKIDSISLALFSIAIIPWLGSLFTKVELPGGMKFEYAPFEKAAEKALEAGLIEPRQGAVEAVDEPQYVSILAADPNLALAGLRIEIERRLRELAKSAGLENSKRGLGMLLRDLVANDVLNRRQLSALQDIIQSLNGAAHGETIEIEQARQVMDIGQQVLRSLEVRSTTVGAAEPNR